MENMIEFAFQKNPSERNIESCLDSGLQASNGTKFGVDLRKAQKAIVIAQIRNKQLTWKMGWEQRTKNGLQRCLQWDVFECTKERKDS